jgi:hypothetical protein
MISITADFIISVVAGLLSGMWVYATNWSDISIFDLNSWYMAFLMTGWMFLFQGIFMKNLKYTIIGLFTIILFIFCIRTQFMINKNQYLNGMITHHSMAIFTSKKLIEKYGNKNINDKFKELLNDILIRQKNEIKIMKSLLNK